MKTPIQELIERLEIRIKESEKNEEPEAVIDAMVNCLVDLRGQLKKEKQHLIDALDNFIIGFDVWFKQRGDTRIIIQDLKDYIEHLQSNNEESFCNHTVDDLMFKNNLKAKCKCGAEWHYE